MRIIAKITPVTAIPLSLPNIMGIGPIIMTPPVFISVFEPLSWELVEDVDWIMLPINIKMIPTIIIKKPAITIVFPFIILSTTIIAMNIF